MKKSVKYTEMSDEALMEKWLSTFGKGVDKNIMEEHVTSYGNLLWHLFTWGEVPCLKGEDARKAVDKDRASDVYIVAKDFSWTYVRTHEEGWCGPYFCKR